METKSVRFDSTAFSSLTFDRLRNAGIARDYQSDAPLNKAPVKSKLFFCRTSAAIGKPFMGGVTNQAIGKLKGSYLCFRK